MSNSKTIIVVGAGFAGLAALKQLKKLDSSWKIILFNKTDYTAMLPSLPDLAADKLSRDMLVGGIKKNLSSDVIFIRDEVISIDLDKKLLATLKKKYSFDYLIIASGSKTNFYNFNKNLKKIYKLDSVSEALKINKDFKVYLKNSSEPHLVLSGAGYTGWELAFALYYYARQQDRKLNVTVIDSAETILPFLPDPYKKYLEYYIKKNNFSLLLKSRVKNFNGKDLIVEHDKKEIKIEKAFFIWTAGTTFSIPVVKGNIDTLGDRRIRVNRYLQIPEHPDVFSAGDAAAFQSKNIVLRKAVNFAISSGSCAGKNLIKLIKGKKLKQYKPFDLGWVIPLTETSIGYIFSRFYIKGRLGLRFHYLMSGYRNFSLRNFWKYLIIAARLFKIKN